MFARRRPVRRSLLVAALAALCLTAPPAHATWSLVVINQKTGEVAVASATCLTGFDLQFWVPVMQVGVGGAAAQSALDSLARNRIIIWNEFQNGTHPKDIIDIIQASDNNFGSRQFGIVDLQGRRGAHTGNQAGGWAGHSLGKSGDFEYSIQGNVLTGQSVVDEAELALINTPGDMAEKLMAAMEAARAQGGDGRCSCSAADPEGCGAPPPNFTKSAHVGFMLISRIGDLDGVCDDVNGCANGQYYMALNVPGQVQADPDPVFQLRQMFDAWRVSWRGRPDHNLSTKTWSDGLDTVPGNGTRAKSLDVALIDWEGTALASGGAQVTVRHAPGSAGLAAIGAVMDHGDGTYTVNVTAGAGQGTDLFEIVVNDGLGDVLLYPYPSLQHLDTLTADAAALTASADNSVNLALAGPEAATGREYLVLASLGTMPGLDVLGVHIPLNFDAVFMTSLVARNSAQLANSHGFLAPDGSGAAQLNIKGGGVLDPLIGAELDFAMITLNPLDFASNPLILSVVP